MYLFSTPLPFDKERIDEFFQINKNLSKSKINTLYNSLPADSDDFTGFEQPRCSTGLNVKTLDDFIRLLDYSLNKGFDFIYLLNSPRVLKLEDRNTLEKQFDKLDKLILKLKGLGLKKYRIANPQLIQHLALNYPDLEVYVSTSIDYFNIKQIENILQIFNNIKEIIPTYEQNRNFQFLKNIKKKFPNLQVEIMVNEGCIQGCPLRKYHSTTSSNYEIQKIMDLGEKYVKLYNSSCTKIIEKDYWTYICTSLIVYPWQIQEYSKIGINNFKLVGRGSTLFNKKGYSDLINWYLKAIEDESVADMIPHNLFGAYLWTENSNILMKDIKPYLPRIEYFKKYGALCASRCGVECHYCYKCAEKLRKKFGDQNKKNS